MAKEIADVLRKAKALIDSPEKLARGWFAKDALGSRVYSRDPSAVCWCSRGALSATEDNEGNRRAAEMALENAIPAPNMWIVVYSDTAPHADVMAWWDRAIAAEDASS